MHRDTVDAYYSRSRNVFHLNTSNYTNQPMQLLPGLYTDLLTYASSGVLGHAAGPAAMDSSVSTAIML